MEEKVIVFLEKNNGCITTKQFEALGVRRYEINEYIDKKIVIRTSRGIYNVPNTNQDELYNYQSKHKNTIFSYDTALYILGLVNEPKYMHVTTYRGNNPVENKKVKMHWVPKTKLNLGVVLNKTRKGNIVKIYNLERTICDIIKNDDYSKEIYTRILKWYFSKNTDNLKLLKRYADLMKISKRIEIVKEILNN